MKKIIIVLLRISLGFIFLWAFVDKTFGLGFATTSENAWISGGSPTYGFLTHATKGPFASLFQGIAGLAVVDWLFMIGLLFIGVSLIINRWVLWGSIAGTAMVLLMYIAVLPPENNPLIDDHIIYALVFLFLGARAYSITHRAPLTTITQ
jgi:thiosulfate dehydrogenase [quinone] large subunit